MSELQLLRWQLVGLLRWLMWEAAMPPWQEFEEEGEG